MRLGAFHFGLAGALAVMGCGSSGNDDLFGGGTGSGGTAGTGGASGASGGTAGTGGATGGTAGNGGVGGAGSGGVGGVSGSGGSGGDCDFNGTWGVYVTIPLTWPATAVLSGSSGVLQVWLKTTRTISGTTGTDIGQLCGIQLPPFQTVLSEQHGVRFLAAAFDYMPEFNIVSHLSGSSPGGSFSTDPAAIIFGARLNNPLADPWPPMLSLATEDDDRDGKPGVTTPAERGAGYALPIVELSLLPGVPSKRAIELFVASRTVTLLTGTAVSCDRIEGQVDIGQIGGAPAFDSAIVGCTLETGGPCSTQQAQFIDDNGPAFTPTSGSTLLMERMPPGEETCAHVRGHFVR